MKGFTLTILNVKDVKKIFGLVAPHVKPGHRTEVLGRMFGWNTYAALLYDLRSREIFISSIDFDRAISFCNQLSIRLDEDDLAELIERLQDEFV